LTIFFLWSAVPILKAL